MNRKLIITAITALLSSNLFANETTHQHGFVLSDNGEFASHLVASSYHSYQVSVSGTLIIPNSEEKKIYDNYQIKNQSDRSSYFILQAQNTNLEAVEIGDILEGEIIISEVGNYEPSRQIVRQGQFRVDKVHIKFANPFFAN